MSATINGLSLDTLPEALAKRGTKAKSATDKFWSSTARPMASRHTEVLSMRFGSRRNVNHLTFEVSRFPLHLTVEWQDKSGNWHPVRYRERSLSTVADLTPRREIPGHAVGVTISQSVPAKITNRRTSSGHRQHYGRKHWLSEEWRIEPVTTDRIRFLLQRNQYGEPPVDQHGNPVAYSLAMRNVKVGFRVTDPDDLPNGGGDIGSGVDLLDSSILYSIYRQGPERAIDSNPATAWLSEPQPINYAVVNLILDTREANGDPKVIDSFYLDPLTPGVHLNLYHSDAEPTGDYQGSSTAVPAVFRDEVGNPVGFVAPGDSEVLWQAYGPDEQTGVAVNSGFALLRLDQPWWVGIDAIELGDPDTDIDVRPLLSLGGSMLARDGHDLTFTLQSGAAVSLPLDPLVHVTGQRYRVILAYIPGGDGEDNLLHLIYQVEGYDQQFTALPTTEFTSDPVSVRVGLHPSPSSDLVSAMGLYGLVLKTEVLTADASDWFLEEGEGYVRDADWKSQDRHSNTNALFRIHPMWTTDENVFGIVGGSDERLSSGTVWTPVPRDYTLRKGFIHLPPTRARYWKFEFTQLTAHVYEAKQTVLRTVQVFPASVVALHNQVGPSTNEDIYQGAPTSTSGALERYDRALTILRSLAQSSATPQDASALVLKDPQQAADVARIGWVWQWQPWHTGSLSPGWPSISQHPYERIPLRHSSKVAYFVGVKEITPYRTNYRADDDTPEYAEHFLDDEFIEASSGVSLHPEGLMADSAYATFESETMVSFRAVRAVQFATVQSGAYEMLPDPNFVDPGVGTYTAYGDANLTWVEQGLLEIERGWKPVSYADLEADTYGDLEDETYGEMEGNVGTDTGGAAGGVDTIPITPIGQGRLDARALVSADGDIGPVAIQILTGDTRTVVAEKVVHLRAGVVTEIDAQFTASAITDWHTYEDLENFPDSSDPETPTLATYGTLEEYTYADLEADLSQDSQVFVRVQNLGQSQDTFRVHKIALYDDQIVWSFSVDDGATWYSALGVRNDPSGVLTFPTPGHQLKWKAEFYRDGATVSALHVKPWYGKRSATEHPGHMLASLGPNQSVLDQAPTLDTHPIWKAVDTPVEIEYTVTQDTTVWRNLAPDPGNETVTDTPIYIEVTGGTVETGYDWEV